MKLILAFTFLIGLGLYTGCGENQFSDKSNVSLHGGPACPGEEPDPNGCLVAKCVGPLTNPSIYLKWRRDSSCTHNPNSNSVQKGDMYPNDPQNFWGWLFMDPDMQHPTTELTDSAVEPGKKYWYRIKYKPEDPSNVAQVALPLDDCTCRY
ncbi:MAG: hypothetical protein IT289_05595 [Oligoflexia bacterium]|nr:hypothetical protein [Oligoflexia bacterium]